MDNKALNTMDYINRMVYLNQQAKVAAVFAPIDVLGYFRFENIHIGEQEDWELIKKLYRIRDDEVEYEEGEPYDRYTFEIEGLKILNLRKHTDHIPTGYKEKKNVN